jgi:hypothetical protein
MGSGFKDFAAGDILTAADVDGYLMRQTVMTFADASARDTALSGVLDEGMAAYEEDTDRIKVYDGSNWDDLIVMTGAGKWADYTPSFSGIGFSSYTARFSSVDNIVHVWFDGVVNSDTGTFEIGMPTAMVPSTTTPAPIGNVRGFDISLSYAWEGYVTTRTADVVQFVTGGGASWGTWSTT